MACYADDDLGLIESSFNAREDLYMISLKGTGSDGSNSILIYDINKKELLMDLPCFSDFFYFRAYLICTQNQNLVYVYEEINLLSFYDLADIDYNREDLCSNYSITVFYDFFSFKIYKNRMDVGLATLWEFCCGILIIFKGILRLGGLLMILILL